MIIKFDYNITKIFIEKSVKVIKVKSTTFPPTVNMWVANKHWPEYKKRKSNNNTDYIIITKYLVLPWAAKLSET